jgi:predicted dehydrogenase
MGAWERSSKLIGQHYPGVKSYSSLEELLADDAVELVVVNTPTYTHYEYALRALQVGKHVIVEKAFTTTVAEAIELQEIAEAGNLKLSVFQNRRWDSDFKTVQSIIKEGILGDPVEVSFSYDRYNPALSPKLHKEIPRPGAGVVYDLGPHVIDHALFLFGMPVSVFADISVTRPTSQVDDYFEIILRYPTFRVRLRASYFVREPVPSYIVHGTKGSFLKTRADVQEASLLAGKKPNSDGYGIEPDHDQGLLHTEIDGKMIRKKIETLPGNYMDYYDGVYRSMVHEEHLPVTAEDGVHVMRIIEAALTSRSTGKVIDL